MKSIALLNKSYYCNSISRVIKQLLIISLCGMLLVVQGVSAYNIYAAINEKQNIANGVYDAVIINLNDPKTIASFPIVKNGNISLIATAKNKNALFYNTLNIGYMDSNAAELSCIKYSAGRAPQKENEIVLEKSAFSVLRKTLNIGDELSLVFDSIDETFSETYEFIVCGIIENYSGTQWKMKDTNSLFPQVLVSKQFVNKTSLPTLEMSLVSFSEKTTETEIEDLIIQNRLTERYFFNEISSIDLELNQFVSIGSIVLILFSGIIAAFLLISYILIKREETQNRVGLYKILGMQRKEIILTLLTRDFPVVLLGGIFGNILGCILLKTLYPIIMRTDLLLNYKVIVLSNIFLLVFYYLLILLEQIKLLRKTISENIKQNKSDKRSIVIHDIKTDIKNPLILWAWKNYNFNRAASTSLCFLILFAIVFSVMGKVAIDIVNTHVKMSSPADVEIVAYNGATLDYIGIPVNTTFGIREEDYSYLLESSNINNIIALKNLIVNIEVPLINANPVESGLWNSNEYKESLKKYGYDVDVGLHQDYLIGADESDIRTLENQKNVQGKINYDAINSAQEVVLCNAGGAYSEYKPGDTLTLTQIIEGNKIELKVNVGAIINFESGNYFESIEALAFGDRMIWGVKSFEKLGLNLNYNHVLMSLKDTEDYENIDVRLNAINRIYNQSDSNNHFQISENFQQAQSYRMMQNVLNIAYVFIIIMVLMFVFTSAVVTTKIRLEQQKKVFASMRAIGLTKKALFIIIAIEKYCQMVFSFAIGLIVSEVFIFLLNHEMGSKYVHFPYIVALIILLFMSITIFLISYVSANSFVKKTIAEQLHHK